MTPPQSTATTVPVPVCPGDGPYPGFVWTMTILGTLPEMVGPDLLIELEERGAALTLIDQSWMPRPAQWFEKLDPITADFTYVRWLGDRKGIEEQTKTWDRVIVDRSADLAEWVEVLKSVHKRKIQIFAYANNHYAGYAPATVEVFQELWRRAVKDNGKSKRAAPQGQLFR